MKLVLRDKTYTDVSPGMMFTHATNLFCTRPLEHDIEMLTYILRTFIYILTSLYTASLKGFKDILFIKTVHIYFKVNKS